MNTTKIFTIIGVVISAGILALMINQAVKTNKENKLLTEDIDV